MSTKLLCKTLETRIVQEQGNSSYTVDVPRTWLSQHDLEPGDKVRVRLCSEPTFVLEPLTERGDYPNTDTRTLYRVGEASTHIAIPIDWAREYGIRPGVDVTTLTQQDGSLVVQRDPTSESSTTEVELTTSDPDSIRREIATAYRDGATRIELTTTGVEHQSVRSQVTRLLPEFLCLEVTEEHDQTIVLTTLLDQWKPSPREAISRLQDALLDIVSEISSSEGPDPELVEFTRQNSEQYSHLLERQCRMAVQSHKLLCRFNIDSESLLTLSQVGEELHRLTQDAVSLATESTNRDGTSELTPWEETTVDMMSAEIQNVTEEFVTDGPVDGGNLNSSHSELKQRVEDAEYDYPHINRPQIVQLAWKTVDSIDVINLYTNSMDSDLASE
ncbi:hypothetical protein [Haloferax gibbonsii]|uniref:hypothetical protein n=1 Tax=Haloferax gibbonsii TaxID=35746 RepID=UPI00126907F1|nr:hypothetical protein [Haloferax gibbonsii]